MLYGDFPQNPSIPGAPRPLKLPRTRMAAGLECFPGGRRMGIEVRVHLIDLKRAFRRLMARLPDESEAGVNFIIFRAVADHLEIVSGGTSETLRATVVYPGEAQVPSSVFRGIARTLRFHSETVIMISFSPGSLRMDQTDYRHPNISLLARDGGQALARTKPAKLQNPR
jgi:hypothetical protein